MLKRRPALKLNSLSGTVMPPKNLYSEEVLFAKKPLNQLSTVQNKVSQLTRQWEGAIGTNPPDYSDLVNDVEKIERQIYEQIGAWKKTPAI